MKEENIERLIPQRAPICLVDALEESGDEKAVTRLRVTADNFFLEEDGVLAEAGLIEHIAQSASAWAGYRALQAGSAKPPVGYIGEVKKFRCHRCPCVGDVLHTVVTMGMIVEDILLVSAETYVDGSCIADVQLKLYFPPEDASL